ncbi:MAG: sorbosone dehydrogenase family protein [Planctomycetota bacterium]
MKHLCPTRRISLLASLLLPTLLHAQNLQFERVASGLNSPMFVTHAPDDGDQLFIAQRAGTIRILDLTNPGSAAATFMTVPGVESSGEGGLLGLAFHPDYQQNGFFYVCYSDWTGPDRTVIARFTATSSTTADPNSRLILLEIGQPQINHNAGWIGFSPIDNLLYVATGDGGGANDTGTGHTPNIGNSQDITNNLLGKMLRIDVDGDDFPADPNRNYAIPPSNTFVGTTGDDEILLYGLRNPFRCSFDRDTGDLYIGDVGQNAREEISLYPAGGSPNRNMGWRLREGTIQTPSVGGAQPTDNLEPIYDYPRSGLFGGRSVTGGMVYRGPLACLNGAYFFADYVSDNFWSFHFDGSAPAAFNGTNHTPVVRWNGNATYSAGSFANAVCFGDDLDGNLYAVDLAGEVFKLIDGTLGIGPFSPACHLSFGDGCADPFAVSSQTLPLNNATLTFDVTDAPEFATGTGTYVGVVVISVTQAPPPGINLSIIGADPNCSAYVSTLDVVTTYVASGTNSASVSFSLPPGIPPGTQIFEQAAAVVSPTASNPAGLLTSNALITQINSF